MALIKSLNPQFSMKNDLFTRTVAAIALLAAGCNKKQSEGITQLNPPKTIAVAPPLGTLEDSAIYRIRAFSSLPAGPVVEVTGNSTAEGAKIQQWGWFPNNGQKWRLIKTDATYYKLVNVTSNKCLESPSAT